MRLEGEYILPLRWHSDEDLTDLTEYLTLLSTWLDVTVVDGSDPKLFAAHATAWGGVIRHTSVTVPHGANGKVRGVLSGLAIARHERVVIADDDVRYDYAALRSLVAALDWADLVRPQNHFVPAPWHARWDTARTLINRTLWHDYPGTYGVRLSTITLLGGYDADVLFENLELERTILAAGGTVSNRPDLFVARRPPSARHFASQRVRQAYDSFAQPWRLVLEAAILPLLMLMIGRPRALTLFMGLLLAAGEVGRRRNGGALVFPQSSVLWVPFWVAERGVATWWAILLRLRGGVRYGGGRIRRAATPLRTLRRRLDQRRAAL